jgi:hypothetical protein
MCDDNYIEGEFDVVQLLFSRKMLEMLIDLINNNNVRTKRGMRITIEKPKYEFVYGEGYNYKTLLTFTESFDKTKCLSE